MSTNKGSWLKRHKILTVIIAIVLLIALSSALGSDNENTDNTGASNSTQAADDSEQTNASEASQSVAKIGETARDGKFEFVVKSLECGKANVGSSYLTKAAQGQYCLLSVSVKNIGDEPQSLFSDNQYLFNASGQKYSADSTATLYAAPDSNSWYSEINPGNSVEGAIVFDIPKDQVPVHAELHDSALSGGTKVSLQ